MQRDTRLDSKAFASAASITAALVFTACAVLVALAPQFATGLLGNAIHLDLNGLTRTLTWASYFQGLFFWTVTVGLMFGIFARLYNALISDRTAVDDTAMMRTRTDKAASLQH